MTTVQQVLEAKGPEVCRCSPNEPVLNAIKMMADRDIGSVMVMDDDRLLGMFTERHYSRNVFLKGRSSPNTPIREVMATELVAVGPERTVEECMALMTEKRVRHLPVMRGRRLVGVISIGDLVKSIIADQKFTIEQLERFIHG